MSKSDLNELINFLAVFPEKSQQIALALREFVWDLYPGCNELIYDNYNFLAFGWGPTERATDIFCSIAVGTRGVLFGFTWGAKLKDPKGLLEGGGKQFRSIRVPDIASFPAAYAVDLLAEAYRYSLERLKGSPQTSNGQTIVKSISPTKRRPGMPKNSPAARRERHPMPAFVLSSLKSSHLLDAFKARPPYQRNDYIGWISSAKRKETQAHRLEQMLDELQRGDVYMKMPYKAPRKS